MCPQGLPLRHLGDRYLRTDSLGQDERGVYLSILGKLVAYVPI